MYPRRVRRCGLLLLLASACARPSPPARAASPRVTADVAPAPPAPAADAAVASAPALTCPQILAMDVGDWYVHVEQTSGDADQAYVTYGECLAPHVDAELARLPEAERQPLADLRVRAREILQAMRAMGFEYRNEPADSRPGVDRLLEEEPVFFVLETRAGRRTPPTGATAQDYAYSCRGIFAEHIAMSAALRRHIEGDPRKVRVAAREGLAAMNAVTTLLRDRPEAELLEVMRWCAGLGPAGVAE